MKPITEALPSTDHRGSVAAGEYERLYADHQRLKAEFEAMRNSVVESCVRLLNVAEYIGQVERERDHFKSIGERAVAELEQCNDLLKNERRMYEKACADREQLTQQLAAVQLACGVLNANHKTSMNRAWLKAVWLASLHWFIQRPYAALFVLPWRAAHAAWMFWMAQQIPIGEREELANWRMKTGCFICPIYNATLQTCGTPGEWQDNKPVGCWCYLPVAASLPLKKCWRVPSMWMSNDQAEL